MTVMQAARSLPAWADAELSSKLPSLCAKGEGQAIEFKLDLPPQSHDIAKSIAAFASSNEGLLIMASATMGESSDFLRQMTPNGETGRCSGC